MGAMKILETIDQLVTAKHVTEAPTLAQRLHAGHMELVCALMRAQTALHESGYSQSVRSALVGPAHSAVIASSAALCAAAAHPTPTPKGDP